MIRQEVVTAPSNYLPGKEWKMEGGKGLQRTRVRVLSFPLPQGPAWSSQLIFLSGDLGDSRIPCIRVVPGIASAVRLSGFKSLSSHSLTVCTWAGGSPLSAYFLFCTIRVLRKLRRL